MNSWLVTNPESIPVHTIKVTDPVSGTGSAVHARRDSAAPFAEVTGIVIPGDRRGRELGFPTANIAPDSAADLPDGVFAGTALREDGTLYLAAVSVGTRATFYANSALRLIEAHLLDFDGDLYGELIEVALYAHLRDQVRFESLDELIEQIATDVRGVRGTFYGHELVGHGLFTNAAQTPSRDAR